VWKKTNNRVGLNDQYCGQNGQIGRTKTKRTVKRIKPWVEASRDYTDGEGEQDKKGNIVGRPFLEIGRKSLPKKEDGNA